MPFAAIDGFRQYYELHGEGPPLLLIPGLPAVASDWFPFADHLKKWFQVIAFDNRGSGRSDAPEGFYSIELFARDAARLLDALGIPRADVFGVSMGGMIAQELALHSGDRVGRLVLGCTHAGGRHAIPPEEEVSRAFALRTEDWETRMHALAPFAFSERYVAEHPAAVRRFAEKKARDVQPYGAYRRQFGAANRHDTFDRLPEIRQPTLVITGTADRVVPPENSRILCERIPGARLATIEGAGHLFFLERPEETLVELLRHLRPDGAP